MTIKIIGDPKSELYEIIKKALVRSFTWAQVQDDRTPEVVIVLDRTDYTKLTAAKIIILGTQTAVKTQGLDPNLDYLALEQSSLGNAPASNAMIRYRSTEELGAQALFSQRYFRRFDFTNEWNNLSYGAIGIGKTIWDINGVLAEDDWRPLGELFHGETNLGTVIGVQDGAHQSILWSARPVGTIDGYDWHLFEWFISSYRHHDLATLPQLLEVPFGHQLAVTMRLDCDENIASARALFQLYQRNGLPFSLAIKTHQLIGPDSVLLMQEIINHQGAILSHSHRHAPNWGGDKHLALQDAKKSLAILATNLPPGHAINYVVSPFHQNPPFAVQALKDAGFAGFAAGIIHNDPEYLLMRSGPVPFADEIFSFSTQNMLHGDCFRLNGKSLVVHQASLVYAKHAGCFYGYLDHPFSKYWYGWYSEEERLLAHQNFLDFLFGQGKVWFVNFNMAMEYLQRRANTNIWPLRGEIGFAIRGQYDELPNMQVRWNSREYELK